MTFSWTNDPQWQALKRASHPRQAELPFFTYQSPHDPYLTCSYYLETDRGVVLVDTQMFRSSVEELWEEIQRNTSGRLFAIVNTHAHPDHINGNGFLRERAPDVMIVTSLAVADDIAVNTPPRIPLTRGFWGDEVPGSIDAYAFPDLTFTGSLTLSLGNVALELVEYGAAEAPTQVMVWIPKWRSLITGDVLQNKQHHYVADREHSSWYSILEQLDAYGAEYYLTGHQGIGDADLLGETKRWLASYVGLIAAELPPGEDPRHVELLDDAGRQRVIKAIKQQFPDWYDACMFDEHESVLEFCLSGRQSEVVGRGLLKQKTGAA
jgi:glyoxylase-like metal-dependent hydrolase (beta-lactamase superfamily II)